MFDNISAATAHAFLEGLVLLVASGRHQAALAGVYLLTESANNPYADENLSSLAVMFREVATNT